MLLQPDRQHKPAETEQPTTTPPTDSTTNFMQTSAVRAAPPKIRQPHTAAILLILVKHTMLTIPDLTLQWLPVKWRINYKIVVLVFRALHGMSPAYVSTLITLITPYEPSCTFRSQWSLLSQESCFWM